MSPSHTLSIVSDFVCPWCFIGKARLDAALEHMAAEERPQVRYLPFKLNPTMPEEGMARVDYRKQKFGSLEHSNELDAQVRQAAEDSGIAIHHDKMERTPNTIKAHMVMAMASSLKSGEGDASLALANLLFKAYFVDGKDIGEENVLVDLAEEAGLPRDVAVAALNDQELRSATNNLADGLAGQGVSGVPTLLLDQHFLISGAVPTDDLVRIIPEAIGIVEKAAG
ncbi:DsbA family oxidoreductase [Ahrensia marina]|uniref:DsbA family oxidoreductase n=1 Tax=Ahrensia marina TaxID=1514904 RepID=UPI0035CEA717